MSTKAVRAVSRTVRSRPDGADEGLLLINMRMETLAIDEGARWILGEDRPEGEASDVRLSLPGEIHDALGRIQLADLSTATVRFRFRDLSYSCRVFLLRPHEPDPQPLLALHIHRDSSVDHTIHLLAKEFNLTEREQEALRAIATGLTSKEVAGRMNVSPNTVKSFLRIIMLKMGVASRAGLLGKLLEYTNSHDGPVTGS